MNTLPQTLLTDIASYLLSDDLKSLRLVNKTFAVLAARYLFSILSVSGGEQVVRLGEVGRERTVEYGSLQTAVLEVLPIAQYFKIFRFSPAFYHNGVYLR